MLSSKPNKVKIVYFPLTVEITELLEFIDLFGMHGYLKVYDAFVSLTRILLSFFSPTQFAAVQNIYTVSDHSFHVWVFAAQF